MSTDAPFGGAMYEVTEEMKKYRQELAAMFLRCRPTSEIREWLASQTDTDYREDMRRRFNELAKTVKRR